MQITTYAAAPDEDDFGLLVMDVLRLLRVDFRGRARGIPHTLQLHAALILLQRNPGCRQTQLAKWLEVTPTTVGRMLDRLQHEQFVRREQDPRDRRTLRVHLLPKATPLIGRLLEIGAQTQQLALNGLSTSERRSLASLLRRVRRNLENDN
jgi:DNA-binding MarR family transcriptional regulator